MMIAMVIAWPPMVIVHTAAITSYRVAAVVDG